MEFYKELIESVLKELNSNSEKGLNDNQVKSARQKYGENVLKSTNSIGFIKIL